MLDKKEQSQDESKLKKESPKKHHIISLKSLINKKKNRSKQKDLIEENNDNENQDNKLDSEKNKNSDKKKSKFKRKKYFDNKSNSEETENFSLFDEQIKNEIVKFNGIKNKFDPYNNILKHCIYLRTFNDFNSGMEKKIFSWKVKILCDTKFIGIGLADKHIVIKNDFRFFSLRKSFYNGVFCLYTLFETKINKSKVYAWHPGNTSLNDNEILFPAFKNGMIITLIYKSSSKTLEFKVNNENNNTSFTMEDVKIKENHGRNIFTPCIIFFYPNEQIQISKLKVREKL